MPAKLTFKTLLSISSVYHATKNDLYAELETMEGATDLEYKIWLAKCNANDQVIRDAYYLDTSHINSRDTVNMVGNPESLIELANKILKNNS